MPRVSMTLSNVEQTISRPVIYSVVNELQEITKISKKSILMFPGDSNVYTTQGSTIESDKNKEALFSSSNIVHIDASYDYNNEDINTIDAHGLRTNSVFRDNLGVALSPIYSRTDVTIGVKYRTPSKTEAHRWRDDIRLRLSQRRDINLHQIHYSYTIPLPYLALLKLIHDRREALAGYNESFLEYLKLYGSDALTVTADVSGIDTSLTLAETQSRIVGIYDFEPTPDKPERAGDDSIWSVSFNYKFTFDKPIAMSMSYPITIHNQALPIEYIDFNEDSINLNRKNLVQDRRLNDIGRFEYDSIYNRITPDRPYVTIPEFDDYILDQTIKSTGTVFVALCGLDESNPTSLLNLDELGEVTLDHDVLRFLKEIEYPYIHKPNFSIFNVSVYRDSGLLEYEAATCDSNLNIILRTIPDYRKQYRVRFSIMTDISLLTKEAIDRLRRYPAVLKKVIACINELIASHPGFQGISIFREMTELEFSVIYRLLTGRGLNNTGGIGTGHYLGPGIDGSNVAGLYKILKDIDPRLLKQYMENTIATRTVQVSRIMAIRKELDT